MMKFLFFCLCLSLGFASPAIASPSPKATLEATISGVLTTLQKPEYANAATRPPLRAQIEKIVEDTFDFTEFSARTVGGRWPSFSVEQQRRFNEAFARLLLSTYLDRVTGYNGEKIDFSGEALSQKGDRAEVSTIVTLGDGKKVPVSYRMMLKNGRWVIYDVIIENVSLIKNYRSQFNEILTKGTPDELITRVQERAETLN